MHLVLLLMCYDGRCCRAEAGEALLLHLERGEGDGKAELPPLVPVLGGALLDAVVAKEAVQRAGYEGISCSHGATGAACQPCFSIQWKLLRMPEGDRDTACLLSASLHIKGWQLRQDGPETRPL